MEAGQELRGVTPAGRTTGVGIEGGGGAFELECPGNLPSPFSDHPLSPFNAVQTPAIDG